MLPVVFLEKRHLTKHPYCGYWTTVYNDKSMLRIEIACFVSVKSIRVFVTNHFTLRTGGNEIDLKIEHSWYTKKSVEPLMNGA